MMSVVTDMGRNREGEREPTWDEAIAALEAATRVEIVRSPREVAVVYRYADGIFTATSPDVKGFRTTGRNLHETRSLVRQDLSRFLDPAVKILERFPDPDREISTSAVGRSWLEAGSLPGMIAPNSSGTARTFVSSARASIRRVRAS